ncbi:MAG: transketolase [Parcubacteria group bacterium]|jgi:transketolase
MKNTKKDLEKINKLLRYWILDMTTVAGSGHPTSSLSAVELISTLLFAGAFRFDVSHPDDAHNDRLIFSKGHAAPLLYALWAVAGVVKPGELHSLRKFGSRLEGHPTIEFPFTEAPTGSLGQGLSIGIGMALAQKNLDHTEARTFVLLGDSEMAEGQIWEAMQIASHYKLDNLVAIVDANRLGQRGETMVGHHVDIYMQRAQAFGWRTVVVDGHDVEYIARIYKDVVGTSKKPLMIIAKTYKGKGISFLEDKHSWHGRVLTEQEFADAVMELGEIDFSVRGEITVPKNAKKEKVNRCTSVHYVMPQYDNEKKYATRDAYGDALVQIMQKNKKVVVLDAEVSNSTRVEKVREYFPERFFEMYIAEQNMISVAVGLSRRGYHPFVSSFAAFLTRAHDQIRMAQYSDVNMTIVGSHAGVSVGEDGSSQMSVDDVGMMRAMFGCAVYCPSDIISAHAVLDFVQNSPGISYVRMMREELPIIYTQKKDMITKGMNIVRKSDHDRIAIIGSGVTVHEALKVYGALAYGRVALRVIDLVRIAPFDWDLLRKIIGTIPHVIVAEDHVRSGGIGEAVALALSGTRSRVVSLCVEKIPHSGTAEELRAYEKINFDAMMNEVHLINKRYDR